MIPLHVARPFFSVVIATHNRPELFERALLSVLRQNFAALEIIVVNDGSTSSYRQVMQRHAEVIHHYLPESVSRGVAYARNAGIARARGRWVVFLDDDDEMMPTYLNDLRDFLRTEGVGFVWSDVELCEYGPAQEIVRVRRLKQDAGTMSLKKRAVEIGASYGLAIKREILHNLGGFDTSFSRGEDTELVIRLLANNVAPGFIPVVGVRKHDHSAPRLTTSFNGYSDERVYERILVKHQSFVECHPSIHAHILSWCALVHIRNGRGELAGAALEKSIDCLRCLSVA